MKALCFGEMKSSHISRHLLILWNGLSEEQQPTENQREFVCSFIVGSYIPRPYLLSLLEYYYSMAKLLAMILDFKCLQLYFRVSDQKKMAG